MDKCNKCGYLDTSTMYTSNPPQYKCDYYGCLVYSGSRCKKYENADATVIGKNIGYYIAKRGMTKKEVALLAGITETSISRYCNGTRIPSAATLFKIACAIECPMEALVNGFYKDFDEKDIFDYVPVGYIEQKLKTTCGAESTFLSKLLDDWRKDKYDYQSVLHSTNKESEGVDA